MEAKLDREQAGDWGPFMEAVVGGQRTFAEVAGGLLKLGEGEGAEGRLEDAELVHLDIIRPADA